MAKVVAAERVITRAEVARPVMKISVTGAAESWNQQEVVDRVFSSLVHWSMQQVHLLLP
jgi:hypothetical protein